jgi:hypothetical protein
VPQSFIGDMIRCAERNWRALVGIIILNEIPLVHMSMQHYRCCVQFSETITGSLIYVTSKGKLTYLQARAGHQLNVTRLAKHNYTGALNTHSSGSVFGVNNSA